MPLAKPRNQNPVHLARKISVTQVDCMLKRDQVERAFLGIIRLFKEESEQMDTLVNLGVFL